MLLAASKDAHALPQVLGLNDELWFPLSDMGWVQRSSGQDVLVNQIIDQMEKVVSPDSLGEGFYCCLRAGLLSPDENTTTTILALYDHVRSIAESTGDPGLNVEVRLGLCRLYRALKDIPTALTWATAAVRVSVRMNYRQFQGIALIERGRTKIEKGDLSGAEKDLRSALEIAEQLRANFDLTRASLYLAALLSTQKKSDANMFWPQVVQLILDHGYDFLI